MKNLIKKFILSLTWAFLAFSPVFWNTDASLAEETGSWLIIPENIDITKRYILSEMKDLRVSLETLKREVFVELQAKEIWAIDKALSYSSNAVSFFSILITILVTSMWIVGWKTISELKKWIKDSMDRETQKIIDNFQEKIIDLEKEQKINILWRQFHSSASEIEKLLVLDKVYNLRPESQHALVERSNIYLSMGLYEKVIEITSIIISSDRRKHMTQALFNRASAYAMLEKIDSTANDLSKLLQIAPDYRDHILENKYFEKVLKNQRIKEILR